VPICFADSKVAKSKLWSLIFAWHDQQCTVLHFSSHRNNSQMRPIATDGVAWSVCVSVCLLLTFVSPAKRLNRSRSRLEDRLGWTHGTSPDPSRWSANFWELSGPLKSIGSHCCGVRSKSQEWHYYNCCSRLHCCRCHINSSSREKSAMGDAAYRQNSLTNCWMLLPIIN